MAIFLVEDHPGHPFVDRIVSEGLEGSYRLLIPDQAPLRARWILTSRWGIRKAEADRAVEDFLRHRRVAYVGASRGVLLKAFDLAKALKHDVYDTFYLALATELGAHAFLTTDADFRGLCPRVKLAYENPVPEDVLRQFGAFPSR
ncbi:MAG: PIN domain-containing protein [Euryarchaeota archaeon]|nr:PIN domain-containing protein [Euryarchaeota archaeon]